MDAKILQSSFQLAAPHSEELAAIFYETLFKRFPAIKPLFDNTNLDDQKTKLIAALKFIVENVNSPEIYAPLLRSLGQRHVQYGAKLTHYPAVGECLIYSLKKVIGNQWTEKMELTWSQAYDAVSDIMLEGAGQK